VGGAADGEGMTLRGGGEADFGRGMSFGGESVCGGVGRGTVGGGSGLTRRGFCRGLALDFFGDLVSVMRGTWAAGGPFLRDSRMMSLASLNARNCALAISASYSEKP
jgi:hypothetical protein